VRHDFLDRYSRLKSPIHRLSAGVKLFVAFALIVVTITVPIHLTSFFVLILAFLLLVAATSRIPGRFLVGRLLMLEPFALGVAVMALFQPEGYVVFLSIVVRSSLCLFTMILVSNTTPFAEILSTLRTMKIPALLITVLALAYRYLFVLIDEGERLQRARRSRTFGTSKTNVWVSLAALISQLFVRSTERAERIYTAMTSRGWK